MNKPIIAIPIGDVSGIGPEIALKALLNKDIYHYCKPLLIGDVNLLNHMIKLYKLEIKINDIKEPSDGKYIINTIDVFKHFCLRKLV